MSDGHALPRPEAELTAGGGAPTAPLVSIVIDNYDYARYLGAAIDSALAQTYPRVEVVVVDDGSTDDSRTVIESYGERVRAVFQENAGQASAIRAGLAAARGEFLIVLDSDDQLAPDVVERVVAEFARDPSCVRVQYRLAVVDVEGRPTGELVPPANRALRTGDLSGYVRRHRTFYAPPTSGNAYRTEALRRVPALPPDRDIQQYTDGLWSEVTTMLGTVRALDGVGGWYRVHGDNHSVSRGRGVEFFEGLVRINEIVHGLGSRLAAETGFEGYPRSVDDPLDAPLRTARLVLRKLGSPSAGPMSTERLTLRAAVAAAVQPGVTPRDRLLRPAWLLLLGLTPAGSPRARRLVQRRYSGGRA